MPPISLLHDRGKEIAHGSERRVYLLSETSNELLKIMRSKHLKKAANCDDRKFTHWLKIRDAFALYRREQKTWQNAMLRAAVRNKLPPLGAVKSLVLLPDALGLTVERVMGDGNATAQTLDDMLADSFGERELDALNTFVHEMYDWHIPAYDLGPKNMVWDAKQERFLLIDGFGERGLIPIKTWIRRLNNRRLDQAFAETAEKSTLTWDAKTRKFSL